MMCYPPAGYIMFSLNKLMFYGDRGPGAGYPKHRLTTKNKFSLHFILCQMSYLQHLYCKNNMLIKFDETVVTYPANIRLGEDVLKTS